jgi:hypothetical protein
MTPRLVKKFRAFFDGDWMSIDHPVSVIELRRFHLRKGNQLAIMPVGIDEIVKFVGGWQSPELGSKLSRWLQKEKRLGDQDGDDEPELTPHGEDYRRSAMRNIRLRRGQQAFRLSLLARYESRCVISNCRVVDILEAAHIRPYRGTGDNHPSNGVLLRSDLHTLYDLDLIGIDPDEGRVSVSERILDDEYRRFHGQRLVVDRSIFPDRAALQLRWAEFFGAEQVRRRD